MAVMQRVKKPKNKRSKRALQKREPKAIENTKSALFIRGKNCSNTVQKCLKDLTMLKKPFSIAYNQKNDIRPFEDATKIEFFSQKMDASLFAFGSHNKKRPNNMVFGRMYDGHLLDMIELGLEAFTPMEDFKTGKVTVGTKPCLLFGGEPFADTTNTEMQRLKSLLIDFFRGPEVTNLRLAGVEHVLQFTAHEQSVFMRSYKVLLKKSGGRIPRVELEEIGPSINWKVRRCHLASDDLFKSACKQVKNLHKEKKVKNMSEDALGTKLGQIHVPAQEISKIQTRKMKGLKEVKKEERAARLEKKKQKAENARQKAVAQVFGEEGIGEEDAVAVEAS